MIVDSLVAQLEASLKTAKKLQSELASRQAENNMQLISKQISSTSLTVANSGSSAVSISPVDGTTLTGTSQTFTWTGPDTEYWLTTWKNRTSDGLGGYNYANKIDSGSGFVTTGTFTQTMLPIDGSTLYIELVGQTGGIQTRTHYVMTAWTGTIAANQSRFNGVGTISPTTGFTTITENSQTVLGGTSGSPAESQVLLENTIIIIGGGARNGAIRIENATNCIIRNCVFWAPHASQQYFDGRSNGTQLAALFVDQTCTNITIEGCNFFGTTHQIYTYRADGTHVLNCAFARPYRHCVLMQEEGDLGGRAALIENCYGHGHPTDDLRSGGSIDGFNMFSCYTTSAGRKHTMRNVFFERGHGANGSCFIVDGFDTNNQAHGDHLVDNCWGVDGANKLTAISGGSDTLITNIKGFQGAQSPARFESSGGVPAYIFDFRSASNPKATNFDNNEIANANCYWYVDDNGFTGTQDALSARTSDSSFAWGWPAENITYTNCDWQDTSLTRDSVRNEAIAALASIPAYSVNNEEEYALASGWY